MLAMVQSSPEISKMNGTLTLPYCTRIRDRNGAFAYREFPGRGMTGLTFHSESSKTANYLNLHLLDQGFINCIISDLKVQKENNNVMAVSLKILC